VVLMSIGRFPANEVRRKVRQVWDWRSVAFAERHTTKRWGNGEQDIWNLSDPLVMAAAVPGLLRALDVRSLLGTVVAPREAVFVPDDENADVVHTDPRLEQVWRREERMTKNMPPDHLVALNALFREAGVRRGFRGGIVAHGADCLRVAELLTIYAFDMCNDVLLVCDETALAVLACHEADVRVYSEDDGVLGACTKILRGLGLKPYPGGVRWMESPPPG